MFELLGRVRVSLEVLVCDCLHCTYQAPICNVLASTSNQSKSRRWALLVQECVDTTNPSTPTGTSVLRCFSFSACSWYGEHDAQRGTANNTDSCFACIAHRLSHVARASINACDERGRLAASDNQKSTADAVGAPPSSMEVQSLTMSTYERVVSSS